MIIHLYCIRVFIYICYDEFHWGKEDKMRGGGGCCEKKLREGMQERGKEDNLRGGVRKNIEGGGVGWYAGEGKEDEMWGGGCENNLKVGGMPERVQKTKCRGGVAEKN